MWSISHVQGIISNNLNVYVTTWIIIAPNPKYFDQVLFWKYLNLNMINNSRIKNINKGINPGKYLIESIIWKSTKDQNDLWIPHPKHSIPR